MQTMPKTANRPMSSNVEAERPMGNTTRNARHPASVVHLTTSPVHESNGTNRLRPTTPTRASAHSHMIPVNCDRPRGSITTSAVATMAATTRRHDTAPRSTTLTVVLAVLQSRGLWR